MTGDVNIDVTANSGANGGDIKFTSTINDDNDSSTSADLTLDTDGGEILISGLIGGNYAVDVIKLNQDDATHEGNITLHGIGSTAANGAGSGAATIGNAATNLLDLTGAFHTGGDTI